MLLFELSPMRVPDLLQNKRPTDRSPDVPFELTIAVKQALQRRLLHPE